MSDFYDNVETPASVMEEVKRYAALLTDAANKVAKAEADLKKAEAEYKELAQNVLPNYYKSNGINKLILDDGTILSVEKVVTCSPTKANKPDLINWLKQKGGEDIVKESLSVDKSFADKLKELAVPFVANGDVNTTTLKAWLKRQLGLSGGEASMDWKDIPDFVNLYQYDTIKIAKKEL